MSNNKFQATSTRTQHAIASFLAGDEQIKILPNFSHGTKLNLMSRSIGPFMSGIEASVPMWVAISLRKRGLARIIPPEFLSVEALEHVLRYERENNTFCPDLPHRHSEIARALLAVTVDGTNGNDDGDIAQPELVRALLEDIETVRMDKIRNNIKKLSEHVLSKPDVSLPAIDVTDIGSLEIQATRPFLAEAFKWHRIASGKASQNNQRERNTVREEIRRQTRVSRVTNTTLNTTFDDTTVDAVGSEAVDTNALDDIEADANIRDDEQEIGQPRSRVRRFR